MPNSIEYKVRNLLRRFGVEVVPTRRRAEASLMPLHVARLFDLYGINVVLDVGARVGEYGTWLRTNGYDGWIVSFEPVSASVTELQATASRDKRWRVMPIALGSEDAQAKINVAAMSQLSSLRDVTDYGRSDFGTVIATDHVEEIEVRRLDTVWTEVLDGIADPRIYLKMDTQGWDLEVLAGAGERIADVAALQTEASVQAIYDGAPSHMETLQALGQVGFTPSGMFPVSLDQRLALIEYDCVAVRR